jgi:hypothetical protein
VTGDRAGSGRKRPRGGVSLTKLRRRCQAKLAELDLELPVPFTMEGFLQALGARFGRRIVLCPVDTRTGPCGLWVATPSTFYFFYERATSGLHKDQILGHEAGHVAFEDASAHVLNQEELAGLLGLDAAMVRRVLGRTNYEDQEEQRAEVFGTVVLERAVRAVPAAPPPTDPEVAEVLRRVQAALTGSEDPDVG